MPLLAKDSERMDKFQVPRTAPFAASYRRILPSAPPTARLRPSGAKATLSALALSKERVKRCLPEATLQRRSSLPAPWEPAEASDWLSGEKATAWIAPNDPARRRGDCGADKSHRNSSLPPPEASHLPSGE